MLDIEEIKARAEAAAVHEYDGITDLIYGRDVKALIAEVGRLAKENHERFEIIGQQGKEMNRRDEIIKQQGQQIDTLERALRNSCEFGIECQAEYGAVDDSEEAISEEVQGYIEQATEELKNG